MRRNQLWIIPTVLTPAWLAGLVAMALLVGCTAEDRIAFEGAQTSDTAEAYWAYLEEYPDGLFADEALQRAESLQYLDAREEDSYEAYETYLDRFPEGEHAAEIRLLARGKLWEAAERANTVEAVREFLERYDEGPERQRALARLTTLTYAEDGITVDDLDLVRHDEDGDGVPEGWVLTAEVTNEGGKDLRILTLRPVVVDPEGAVVALLEDVEVAREAELGAGEAAAVESLDVLEQGASRGLHLVLEDDEIPDEWAQPHLDTLVIQVVDAR